MGKLTPTFADAVKDKPPVNGGHPSFKVVEAHEPLASETPPAAPPPNLIQGLDKPAEPEQKPLKIALVGTAPSSRMLAPFQDPSWTIWACSPGNQGILPRVDAWFEIHGNLHWPENRHYGEPYVNWLRGLTIPVYMQNQQYVPNAVTFPMVEMVKRFGQDFFTSSFAWMMAFAISKGAKEIALFGIDMASRDEYILQRPGFFFFKTIANMNGIAVSAPYESDIMQSPGLYGYSEVVPFGRKILAREIEIKQRLDGMRPERDKMVHNITYLEGALEDLDYIKNIQIGVTNDIAMLRAERDELLAKVKHYEDQEAAKKQPG